MLPRIVVTGMGIVSAAGVGTEPLRTVLQQGQSCVHRIEDLAASTLPCTFGAAAHAFNARDFLTAREAKRLDRSAQLFVAAGHLALTESALLASKIDSHRIGVFEGTSLGGLATALAEHNLLLSKGAHFVNPHLLSAAMTGAGGSMLSLLHRLHGPVMTFSNGSVSSACAIAAGVQQLRLHEIDAAIVGGSEAPLHYPVMALFCRAGMLSSRNEAPETACRPFDATRDGVVLGEGGGALVLERLESAHKRSAKIFCEILATAFTSEAYNSVAPAPDAAEQTQALQLVLARAQVQPEEIDFISAHGTATLLNDRAETLALKQAFGAHAYKIPVSAMKSMFGHTLGACSALEIVATIIAMQHEFVPPTINYQSPDPACDLDYVPTHARRHSMQVALVKNASFGGKNSAILLRRFAS